MSEPDQEPLADDPGVRAMTIPMAVVWTVITTFSFLVLLSIVYSLRPESDQDIVSGIACQFIAYMLGLFFILRMHAPTVSIRSFLGIRPTSVGFYPLAIGLGISLQLPLNALYSLLVERFPTAPSKLGETFHAAPVPERIIIAMGLIAIGPLVEEIFFRGAIFLPLRLRLAHKPYVTVITTALLFAVVHIEWQQFLWIFIMGVLLGVLRRQSGSLVPCVLAHAAFNAVATLFLVFRLDDLPGGMWVAAASTAVALVLVGLIFVVGKGERAQEARREEELWL